MPITIHEPVQEVPEAARYERLPNVWAAVRAAKPDWVPITAMDADHAHRIARSANNKGFQARRIDTIVYIRERA